MSARTRRAGTLRQVITLLLVVTLTIVLLMLGWDRMRRPSREPTRTWIDSTGFATQDFDARCGPGNQSPVLEVVISPEKGDWIDVVADAYMKMCGQTRLRVVRLTDLEALRRIERGQLQPAMWLPSDSIYADLLDESWSIGSREALEHGPSLLRTPLVLLAWTERLEALDQLWPGALDSPTLMSELMCPGIPARSGEHPRSASTWAAWAGVHHERGVPQALSPQALEAWGRVEIGYTDPARQSTGMNVLLAAAYGYFARTGTRPQDAQAFEDALEHGVEIEDWLLRCQERTIGPTPLSARRMGRYMHIYGHEYRDGVLIYEHVALELLAKDPRMSVAYPRNLHVPDHPVVVFPGPWKVNAKRLEDFLISEKMQRQAFMLGLRPAQLDSSMVQLSTELRASALTRGVPRGVQLSLDESEPLPHIARDPLLDLLHTWSTVTGRY